MPARTAGPEAKPAQLQAPGAHIVPARCTQRRHPIRHRSDTRWRKNGSCPSICIPEFSCTSAENLVRGTNAVAIEITPPKTQPATKIPMASDATTSSNIKIRNRPVRKNIKNALIDQIITLYVVVLRYSPSWASVIELSPQLPALNNPGSELHHPHRTANAVQRLSWNDGDAVRRDNRTARERNTAMSAGGGGGCGAGERGGLSVAALTAMTRTKPPSRTEPLTMPEPTPLACPGDLAALRQCDTWTPTAPSDSG
ncbi:hypothetical protein EDC02_0224 [Micromonospora sp. Llam0]|nr:hypothetical protein EDC02_0224 [Micromonospora sp. Llam0]